MKWRECQGCAGWRPTFPARGQHSRTRLGGVSEAPFDSLNLGVLTADEPALVRVNRGRLLASAWPRSGARPRRAPGPWRRAGAAQGAAGAEPVRRAWNFRTACGRRPVTPSPNWPPWSYVADCLPIALAGPAGSRCFTAVGGVAAGIVARGADAIAPPTPRSDPGSAPAATRSAKRCWAPSPGSARASATVACWTCPRSLGDCSQARRRLGRVGRACAPLRGRAVLLPPPRRGPHRASGSGIGPGCDGRERAERCREPVHGLEPARVAANLERVRERGGGSVEILAASKYVPSRRWAPWPRPASPGRRESPAGARRQARALGAMPSVGFRRQPAESQAEAVAAVCRLIHSVASDSALEQLGRHGGPETEVLVEVNVAAEEGKGGVAPADLADFLARCPVRRRWPDDDAPLHPGAGDLAPIFRPSRRARRPSTA